MTRRGFMSAVLVAGVLAVVPGSASAAGWLPSVNVAWGDYGRIKDVAVDAQGDAVAVWGRHISGLDWAVVAATRPVGGIWSAPVDISPVGSPFAPTVAVDPQGDAVAIWTGEDDPQDDGPVRWSIWAASLPAGGAWSEPVRVASIRADRGHELVMDASGNATVVWCELLEEGGHVVRAASLPSGGTWSDPVDLFGPSEVDRSPRVAVNPDGDLTAAWTMYDSVTDRMIVQSKSRPAGGAWDADATDLSSDEGNAGNPAVVVGPGGSATAAWPYSDGGTFVGGSGDFVVQAAQRSTDGGWSQPVEVSDGSAGQSIRLAVDSQGEATAVWPSYDSAGVSLLSSSLPSGGTWSAPVQVFRADTTAVTAETTAGYAQLVVDPHGDAMATWQVNKGPSELPGVDVFQLEAARRTGGTWGAPVPVSPPNTSSGASVLAVDPQGYVTALWTRETTFSVNTTVGSRVFDPVAPLLNDVVVPARGVVGQPVSMSVDPFDVWSSVTTTWEFGDGGSGSGATVEHCYSSPGEHTVAITGADLAENETRATQTITIEPVPEVVAGPDPCAAPEPGPGDPGPGPNPAPVIPGPGLGPELIVVPVVSGLEQSSSRWRVRAVKRQRRLPVGTTFRFGLNRAASVRFSFSRVVSGRRTGGRCVKPTKANRGKPLCRRYPSRGRLTMTGRAGSNVYAFRGRIDGRTLKPGRYRLRVTAVADGKTSAPVSIRFTIAR